MSDISEKLAALRERAARPVDEPIIEPDVANPDTGFKTIRWFDRVTANPTPEILKEAGVYYQQAVEDGRRYAVPLGNLQKLFEQHSGIVYYYNAILVDCQQVRRWLEMRAEIIEAERYRFYMYDEEAHMKYGAVKTTEAAKLAKSDPMVQDYAEMVRYAAYYENHLNVLVEALDNVKYTLNNIRDIRQNGLEEVWVDPTHETQNS